MHKIDVFDGNEFHTNPTSIEKRGQNMFTFKSVDEKSELPFNEELLSQHIMFLGGIGTGKTTAILQAALQIRDNMKEKDVMLVFDAKGDYYDALYREGRGIDVVISNDDKSIGIGGEKDYWNIFGEISRDEHMEEDAYEIAKNLFYEKIKNTQQPFFPNAAKDLFYAVVIDVLRWLEEQRVKNECKENNVIKLKNKYAQLDDKFDDYITYIDNADIREFFNKVTAEGLNEKLDAHEDLMSMKSYLGDGTSDQALGVLAELQQLVREIFVGNFKKPGKLSIRQLIRNKGGRIIFIEYDLGLGNVLTPIYRLLFDLAFKEALCRTKSDGNVYFLVDEFKLLPHLQHVDDAVNFGRSLGVKMIIGIQNIDQIFDNYGEARARSLLSGFLTSVAFRVNDEHSKDFIKGLHGENRKKEIFLSTVQNKGIIEQIRDAHVVEDWDISRLGLGQAIIGLPGKEPFLFQFKKA